MAVTPVTRNLKDGAIVIKDGAGSPLTCTISCDVGDLRWNSPAEWRRVLCRGTFDHRRPGDDVEKDLSFTVKWMQLLGYTNDSSDAIQPYEMIENLGSAFTSTATGYFALNYEFTCTDPEAAASEKVTFTDVVKEDLECQEGDEFNSIAFSGKFDVDPTVTRV